MYVAHKPKLDSVKCSSNSHTAYACEIVPESSQVHYIWMCRPHPTPLQRCSIPWQHWLNNLPSNDLFLLFSRLTHLPVFLRLRLWGGTSDAIWLLSLLGTLVGLWRRSTQCFNLTHPAISNIVKQCRPFVDCSDTPAPGLFFCLISLFGATLCTAYGCKLNSAPGIFA